ncbi:MAG: hypothetical protein IID45_01070 [Planctomycetes bacterium]|nr:hypothetical protein [Planctomycetota bacterium]
MNPTAEISDEVVQPLRKRPRSLRRRLFFWTVYGAYVAGLFWVGVKVFWYVSYDVPITRSVEADDIWQIYFPELWKSKAVTAQIKANDETFDVLLLGASVLEQTADVLETELQKRLGSRLRLFNLAISAHTTRDSSLKFSRLRGKKFDLIIIYHGINDVRMNCCREADFRDDYTHCARYSGFQRRLDAKSMMILKVAADVLPGKIAVGKPDEEMLDRGGVIKTENAFRRNIESIVAAAESEGIPVALMTFAWHIPDNYSRQRFMQRELDYGSGHFQLETELWGRPRHVAATIAVHNAVIRKLASRHRNVCFVDQQELMPHNGRHFSDLCHLTQQGCRRFVSHLMSVLDRRLRLTIQTGR